jgi:hypothetical protein
MIDRDAFTTLVALTRALRARVRVGLDQRVEQAREAPLTMGEFQIGE